MKSRLCEIHEKICKYCLKGGKNCKKLDKIYCKLTDKFQSIRYVCDINEEYYQDYGSDNEYVEDLLSDVRVNKYKYNYKAKINRKKSI